MNGSDHIGPRFLKETEQDWTCELVLCAVVRDVEKSWLNNYEKQPSTIKAFEKIDHTDSIQHV